MAGPLLPPSTAPSDFDAGPAAARDPVAAPAAPDASAGPGASASSAETAAREAPRERHDAFTEARKAEFLSALVKTGCIQEACRRTRVAPRTVYRHQESDPRFFEHCRTALRMSATPIELTAWSRAVEGVEQEFACGGQVHVRRRYDSGLLRLLLQGSNPKKYGRNPGFSRKKMLKSERGRIEREIRAEIAAERPTFEEAIASLEDKLKKATFRMDGEGLAGGWTVSPEGDFVPPGYARIPGWSPPPAAAPDVGPPGDCV